MSALRNLRLQSQLLLQISLLHCSQWDYTLTCKHTQDINSRISKLTNGASFHTNTTFSIPQEDLSEDAQIHRILSEAHDSVQLDILSAGCNIREEEEEKKGMQIDNRVKCIISYSHFADNGREVTHNRKNNKTSGSKNSKKKKHHKKKHSSSSSDSSDDSLSSSEYLYFTVLVGVEWL